MLRELAAEGGRPFLVIGGGSNIAFPDGLTRAAVVLALVPAPRPAAVAAADGRSLQVDGGMRNQLFLSWCAANGAGGLEFLSGIPGTLGGAAAVNAGAFGGSLADVLLGADIVDERGEVRAVDAGHFASSYRDSRFKIGSETLLALRLSIHPGRRGRHRRKGQGQPGLPASNAILPTAWPRPAVFSRTRCPAASRPRPESSSRNAA